jgi:nucleoporin NUP159
VPRLSQVVFSSDESCLVISAEEGGGLAVYETDGLLNGKTESAFQVPTNGVAVRQILANPSKDNSHQFGLVLSNGQLLLADLKQRQLVNGASGSPVFKENVSCACWSRLGKQIVVGLADGTAAQVDLQGNTKAVIPKPPQVAANRDPQEQGLPVTAIYWLETLDFLMIHSPINPPADGDGMGPRNDAEYHLVHRDKATGNCSYHQFMDPCPGFMDQRVPTHHFIQRLRECASFTGCCSERHHSHLHYHYTARGCPPRDPSCKFGGWYERHVCHWHGPRSQFEVQGSKADPKR